MKHIDRCSPPPHFVHFVAGKPKHWKELADNHHTLYEEVRETLAKDQGDKSGYTELPLTKKPNAWHIDHFRKQEYFPDFIFDWQNLIVDDHTSAYGADYKDTHIKKGDNQKLINPVTEQPSDFFTYNMNGEIMPRNNLPAPDKSRAEDTIRAFNLNHPELKRKRIEVAKYINEYKHGGLNDTEIAAALNQNYGLDTFVSFTLCSI